MSVDADIHVIETISRNCYRSFAGFPNAETIDNEKLFAVLSHVPIPFFSGVAHTNLGEGDVEAMIERLQSIGSPFRWWVTPSTRPTELASSLLAHGFRHAYDAPGMLAGINARKRVMLTPAILDGVFVIRIAISSHRTHRDRVDMGLEDIRAEALRSKAAVGGGSQ